MATYSYFIDGNQEVFMLLSTTDPTGDLEAWKYCKEKSHSIEFVYKTEESDEEVLARVHFIMDNEVQTF